MNMKAILAKREAMRNEWGEQANQCEWVGDITMEDLMKHRSAESCWCAIRGDVYDMTQYLHKHPGGAQAIIQKPDLTQVFKTFHKHIKTDFLHKLKIGRLVGSDGQAVQE